mmetsp:Transcript_5672/g.6222  ORF Transcript_5672/g.6222 Transcript_5672/m.6222 type:complete len:338 (+) Transcript_5672:37-1050(+)
MPTSFPPSLLPSPKQCWSHGTCTQKKLVEALANPNITAIESDLVIGSVSNDSLTDSSLMIPIMAHPPDKSSDLSIKSFLQQVTTDDGVLKKHIKLDFKQMKVVSPTFEEIIRQHVRKGLIFLNADILPGPGFKNMMRKDIYNDYYDIHPEEFLQVCLKFLNKFKKELPNLQLVFSIGFKADVLNLQGFSQSHIEKMINLIRDYDLISYGVVLPINARLLVKNVVPFQHFLNVFPNNDNTQLLAWTATGEPPISLRKVKQIKSEFAAVKNNCGLGFDCAVADGVCMGYFYDLAFEAYAIWLLCTYILTDLVLSCNKNWNKILVAGNKVTKQNNHDKTS